MRVTHTLRTHSECPLPTQEEGCGCAETKESHDTGGKQAPGPTGEHESRPQQDTPHY